MKRLLSNLTHAPFALALAIFAMISAIRNVFDRDFAPIHAALHGFDYYWSAAFFFGGLALAIGMMLRRANIEAAGCALFAVGAFTEAVSFAVFNGWTKSTSWVTVLIYMSWAILGGIRFWRLWHGEQIEFRVDGNELTEHEGLIMSKQGLDEGLTVRQGKQSPHELIEHDDS